MSCGFPIETAADKLWDQALLARIRGDDERATELEEWVLLTRPEGFSEENLARYRLNYAKWAAWGGASLEWIDKKYIQPVEWEMLSNTNLTIEVWAMRAYIAVMHPIEGFRDLMQARQALDKAEQLLYDCNDPTTNNAVSSRLSLVRRELKL